MVDPGRVPGEHDIFVCGDDDGAKAQVRELLESFGWPSSSIIDLGGIASARGTEGHLLLWLRLWGALGSGDFTIKVVSWAMHVGLHVASFMWNDGPARSAPRSSTSPRPPRKPAANTSP
jgi:hypothetical protein